MGEANSAKPGRSCNIHALTHIVKHNLCQLSCQVKNSFVVFFQTVSRDATGIAAKHDEMAFQDIGNLSY